MDGRSLVPNATGELSHDRLTVEMEGWIYKALVIAFGDRRKANNSGLPTMRFTASGS
jgi:hypothetical protein